MEGGLRGGVHHEVDEPLVLLAAAAAWYVYRRSPRRAKAPSTKVQMKGEREEDKLGDLGSAPTNEKQSNPIRALMQRPSFSHQNSSAFI